MFCVGYAHHGDKVALYAGTEPASMFRSDDYGKSWVEQPGVKETKGRDKWSFPSPLHLAHVKTMTIDPRDPNRLFAAVMGHPYGPSEERGIYRSTDGGATWKKVLYKDANTGGSGVVLDPTHPDTVYASSQRTAARRGSS